MDLSQNLSPKSETIVAIQYCIRQLAFAMNNLSKIIKWFQAIQTEVLNIRDTLDLTIRNRDNDNVIRMSLEIAMLINKTFISNNKLHTIKCTLDLFIKCNDEELFDHSKKMDMINSVVKNMNSVATQYNPTCDGDLRLCYEQYVTGFHIREWIRRFNDNIIEYVGENLPHRMKEVNDKLKMYDALNMDAMASIKSISDRIRLIASHIRICAELDESTRENALLAHFDACLVMESPNFDSPL